MPEKVVKPLDRPCQTCRGTGKVTIKESTAAGVLDRVVVCPACRGQKVGGSGLMTK